VLDTVWREENNCLNGVFKDNPNMISLSFVTKQTESTFGYFERLFLVLKHEDSDDYSKIKWTPLPIETAGN
jgi:hypothetical protein